MGNVMTQRNRARRKVHLNDRQGNLPAIEKNQGTNPGNAMGPEIENAVKIDLHMQEQNPIHAEDDMIHHIAVSVDVQEIAEGTEVIRRVLHQNQDEKKKEEEEEKKLMAKIRILKKKQSQKFNQNCWKWLTLNLQNQSNAASQEDAVAQVHHLHHRQIEKELVIGQEVVVQVHREVNQAQTKVLKYKRNPIVFKKRDNTDRTETVTLVVNQIEELHEDNHQVEEIDLIHAMEGVHIHVVILVVDPDRQNDMTEGKFNKNSSKKYVY